MRLLELFPGYRPIPPKPVNVSVTHTEIGTTGHYPVVKHEPKVAIACKNGHPYTEENTLIREDGYRRCMTCHNEKLRWARANAKAKAHD